MNHIEMSSLTHGILSSANIGLWTIVQCEDGIPKLYADEKMIELLGSDSSVSPEDLYKIWVGNVEDEYRDALTEYSNRIVRGEFAEVQYAWHHPKRGRIFIRCCGVCDKSFTQGFRAEGCHQDVTEIVNYQRKAAEADLSTNIAKSLSMDYLTIVYVNIEDCSYVKISAHESVIRNGLDLKDPDYFKAACENVSLYVYEDDVEMMLEFFQKKTILRELEESSCIFRIFRVVIEGRLVYHRIKVIRTSDDAKHFIFALENIDEDERSRLEQENEDFYRNNIIKILARNFTGLYLLNLENETGKAVVVGNKKKKYIEENFVDNEELQKVMLRFVHTEVHPEDRELLEGVLSEFEIKKRLARKKSFSVEFRRECNGTYKFTKMMVAKVEAVNIAPVNVAIGFIENDDEVRARQEQKKIVERDLSVIASLSDDFGCVVYVNIETGYEISYRLDPIFKKLVPDWMEITNFEKRLEKIAKYVVHPEDRSAFVEATSKSKVSEVMKNGKIYFVNFRVLLDGEIVYYQVKFVKDEKSADHFIAGFHNVDEETKREMAALEKAEMASRAKSSFLFNMSHDIRTPMNSIMGFTDMAIKNVENKEKTLDYLHKAKSSSNHLLSLLNDILDMSRIESGKLDITEEPVDLLQCIRDSSPMLNALAEKKNIAFSYVSENIVDKFVYADYLHFNQVMINLVSNAVKYTPEGGYVQVSVTQKDCSRKGYGLYSISVKDNGIGMDDEFQKHMFEQFTREKTSTVSRQQGTGLGLAITKSIIDKMGGSIEVQSKPGVGSTFCITLPLRLQENPEATEQFRCVNENVGHYSFEGKKVLVVEDNPLNREIAEDLLSNVGFLVECAEDGSIAVNYLREKGSSYYDCILMDVQMPVMDGYEASRNIREMYPDKHIPIIALSANAFEEDRKKSIEAGMDDHQSKPIVVSLLFKTLSKLL